LGFRLHYVLALDIQQLTLLVRAREVGEQKLPRKERAKIAQGRVIFMNSEGWVPPRKVAKSRKIIIVVGIYIQRYMPRSKMRLFAN